MSSSENNDFKVNNFNEAHGSYSEAYNMGVEFALLTDDNELVHNFTYCKDFLTDVFFGFLESKSPSIYGFSWTFGKSKNPSINPLRVLIRDKKYSDNLENRAKNTIELLNIFERKLGFTSLSNAKALEDVNCIFVKSPKEWGEYPVLVSAWSLIIRNGYLGYQHVEGEDSIEEVINNCIKNLPNPDPAHDKSKLECLSRIVPHMKNGKYVELLKNLTFKNYVGQTTSTLHNSSGVMALDAKIASKKELIV